MLEIEIKARVKNKREIKARIREAGGEYLRTETQDDAYFAHPSRDFANTDEAVRIRTVGDEYFFTYKGKKLDYQTKTREEIEIHIGSAGKMAEILERLGFTLVANVIKVREYYSLDDYWVAVDEVFDVGLFIEIEKHGTDYEPDELVELIESLGIERTQMERKSYLELLLESKRRLNDADGNSTDV
ncbi:class IV adenylate cyclase [archaeon]|nr:class IV adenylate cyclase [archaeon]